ncbi:hypothetical protein [Sphingobacterium hungaricum]|uniref:Uncharacterized protein n=1 Tax=Sphingobacterium hungaricum TaxID=2082723 RepID=A0A928UUE0_9SPHI|nr:hypothetical protein [Sphingobacterium hungaricum]MBE8713093.1 hypothetical protein [Sphingobacterium hungaricum]
MTHSALFLLSLSFIFFLACTPSQKSPEQYRAIYKRDTAYIDLHTSGNEFYGKYKIVRPGNAVDAGDIRGKINNDTLSGDFYYHAFGWQEKQRKPFAVLRKNEQLILGTGISNIYLGMPYYKPGTHSFDSLTFVFLRI